MDDLGALLHSREWVKRRIDRVEFLDLMTVRRTTALTVDLAKLKALRPYGRGLVPLGWFVPWANADTVLLDAGGGVAPYLPGAESDELVRRQLEQRFERLYRPSGQVPGFDDLAQVPRQRTGAPPSANGDAPAGGAQDGKLAMLAGGKWGCHAVRDLLVSLSSLALVDDDARRARGELAKLLLAWQTNFVVFARFDAARTADEWTTFRLSYDEQLDDWKPPWEVRCEVGGLGTLPRRRERECRKRISRGGPFHGDLDELRPPGLHGWLAARRSLRLRRLGRRGALGVTWHVAWHQAGGLDVPVHQVDVVLPRELTAVRIRMLRAEGRARRATVADQVGSHASIVAPQFEPAPDGGGHWLPSLFSLVIAQRSPASWYGGCWIAALTGVALLAVAWWRGGQVLEKSDAAVAILVLAPTLVSALLAVQAGSEIAEQLAATPRRLIGLVGVLAAISAIGLAVEPGLCGLQGLWSGTGLALLATALTLWRGGRRIERFLHFGGRVDPRYVPTPEEGEVLNPADGPRIGPPDRWLAAGEGDLVPWGWLHGEGPDATSASVVDAIFWGSELPHARGLVGRVQETLGFELPAPTL